MATTMPVFGPAEQLGIEPGECRYCGDVIDTTRAGADLDEGVCSWECRAYLAEDRAERAERRLQELRQHAGRIARHLEEVREEIQAALKRPEPTERIMWACGGLSLYERQLRNISQGRSPYQLETKAPHTAATA